MSLRTTGLGLGLLATCLGAGPMPPTPLEPAALVLVEGRDELEDRLIFLPVQPAGGLRLARPLLERVAPDLASDLLTTFFHREGLPGAGAPPQVSDAAILFGAGGGAFRLGGDLTPKLQGDFWEAHGLDWGPEGGAGRALEGEELWGWLEGELLYGAWGHRARHAWLKGLDGRGRRLYPLGRGPRREALAIWSPEQGARQPQIQALSQLPEGAWPARLRRLEVALMAPGRGAKSWSIRVRLIPEDSRRRDACADWLRMFWHFTDAARVRRYGAGAELRYELPRDETRKLLLAWAQVYGAWLRGDAYRSML